MQCLCILKYWNEPALSYAVFLSPWPHERHVHERAILGNHVRDALVKSIRGNMGQDVKHEPPDAVARSYTHADRVA